MRTLKHELVSDLNIGVNEQGFLMKTETWTKDVAKALAQEEMQSSLTEDH